VTTVVHPTTIDKVENRINLVICVYFSAASPILFEH
jgi:hypothetical protein